MVSTEQKPADRTLLYAFYGLLVWLPLPLGSNRTWAWSLMCLMAFGLLLSWLLGCRTKRWQAPAHFYKCAPLLFGLLGFQLLLAIQLLSLPISWVTAISPLAAQAYNFLGSNPQWATLSVDPSATTAHLMQGLGYCAIAALTLLLINNRQRLKALALCLIIAGLIQAVWGAFMTLSGIEYSFLLPKNAHIGNATGTFLNRNHFANYLTLCAATATGLLLAELYSRRSNNWRERSRRIILALLGNKAKVRISLAIMVIAIVLSHSRMGNTAFFFSLASCGFLWLLFTKRMTRGALFLLCSLIAIDLLIVGTWFGIDKVKERLEGTALSSETRDEAIRDSLPMIGDYWLVGSGAGSYYGVFPSYRNGDIRGFYDHAHNDYIQLIAEHGATGAGILLFIVLSSLWQATQAMRLRKSSTYKGLAFAPLMATCALALHSLTDFNLQIPANTATYIVLLCMAWLCRYLPNSTRQKSRYQRD